MIFRPVWLQIGRILFLLCAVTAWTGAMRPAAALTYDEERKMGREVLAEITKKMELVKDPAISAYINQLGKDILQVVGPQPFDYHFFVVKSSAINAFAVPAGYIFINSETISAMENEGELAAILAHEIAHVTGRHISERLADQKRVNIAMLAGVLAGALVGGPAGQALIMGSVGGGIQTQLAYSRDDEREADGIGLNYLVQAGYNPQYMADAFKRMMERAYAAPTGIPTYLSTHPGMPERVVTVERAVKSHPEYGKVKGAGDRKMFEAIQNRVVAMTADPNRARTRFQAMLKDAARAGEAHYGLGLVYMREQRYQQAAGEFQTALKSDPANPAYLTDLGGVLFQSGNLTDALKYLERAVVLRPKDARALYLLARANEETGALDRARQLYERAVVQNPDYADALYSLGNLYGRQGDLARAHLHTGLYFQVEGELDKALYHLNKAQQNMVGASGETRRKIEKALSEVKNLKK